MEELSHRPCPNPDCSSTDAFSYNVEKQIGYCHSCGQGYPKKGITYEEEYLVEYPIINRSYENEGLPTMAQTNVVSMPSKTIHREYRGITEDTMSFYTVSTAINFILVAVERLENYLRPSRLTEGSRLMNCSVCSTSMQDVLKPVR
jgi:hypothetical protein